MRNILLIIILSLPLFSFSQDTVVDRKIRPVWVEPETVFKPKQEKIEEAPKEEEEALAVVESVQKDLQFLEALPKTYDVLPKEDLKNVLKEIDNKINRLIQERDSLLQAKVVNEKLVETKEGTIKTLKKEKNIVSLTLESGDLKDQNGNLIVDKDIDKDIDKEKFYKKLIDDKFIIQPGYTYFSFSGDKFDTGKNEIFKKYLETTKFDTIDNGPKTLQQETITKIIDYCNTTEKSFLFWGGKNKHKKSKRKHKKTKRTNKTKKHY